MKISILKLSRPSQDGWLKCLDRYSLIVTALWSGLHPLVSSIDQLRPPNTLTKVKGKAEAKQLRSLTQAFGENRKWQSSFCWVREAEGAWGWESGVGALCCCKAPYAVWCVQVCRVVQLRDWDIRIGILSLLCSPSYYFFLPVENILKIEKNICFNAGFGKHCWLDVEKPTTAGLY